MTGCVEWAGRRDRDGYGRLGGHLAHRLAFESEVGPIPDGHHVDHLCFNRACVNPDHLEAVTPTENQRRAAARKTHCKHGHPYSPENTYTNRGKRYCRICNREAQRRRNARAAA